MGTLLRTSGSLLPPATRLEIDGALLQYVAPSSPPADALVTAAVRVEVVPFAVSCSTACHPILVL